MIEQINSYSLYLRGERRYSNHTTKNYISDLMQCHQYLESSYELKEWGEVIGVMLRSYVVKLSSDGLRARTINRKISALRSFFQYLKKLGVIQTNPTSRIVSLKTQKRLPETINEDAFAKLSELDPENGSFGDIRDFLMLELLYQTGMRRAELIHLRHQDIDLVRKTILVFGKGNKQRIIPMSPKLLERIERYVEAKEEHLPNSEERVLIVTDKGKRLYPKFVYNRIVALLSSVSTSKKRSPHVLRHTFATHLTNNGAELNAVKELLGHASLAATQIYTHNSIEKLKKAYSQAHPKS